MEGTERNCHREASSAGWSGKYLGRDKQTGNVNKGRKKTQNKSGTPDALSLSGPRSLLRLKPALSLRTPCFDSRQTSSCRLSGGGGLEEGEEEPAEMEALPWEPGISHGRRSPL